MRATSKQNERIESGQDPVRCVNAQGFSLHAEVRCALNQRHKLEHLCRYITRPAIANKRLKRNSAGDAVLQLKVPTTTVPPIS